MENTSVLKIEAGKFYRMRNGNKYECLKMDVCFPNKREGLVGLQKHEDGTCGVVRHYPNGRYYEYSESGLDIITPWIDKPEVDWSKMPAWCNHVVMNESGNWRGFELEPSRGDFYWYNVETPGFSIPPEYAPKWTGDWRDSLASAKADSAKADSAKADSARVDWQPIETAPKDGTNVIVCIAGLDRSTGESFWWEGAWRTWDGENHIRTYYTTPPTHWMPLPKAPAIADAMKQ